MFKYVLMLSLFASFPSLAHHHAQDGAQAHEECSCCSHDEGEECGSDCECGCHDEGDKAEQSAEQRIQE